MTGHPTIPEVTDEDIAWIADTMGLDDLDGDRRAFLKRTGTFDVSACPGSGKTTLVVAKLAILAKNWRHPTSGICVLSHTNVAREEIQNRLGHTPVGHRLLRYPHFIDTIHTFANRFLALPYLRSNGFLKWSGKFGQRAKMYPTTMTGYKNDEETQFFRQVQSYGGA